jgi:hypothetical protein
MAGLIFLLAATFSYYVIYRPSVAQAQTLRGAVKYTASDLQHASAAQLSGQLVRVEGTIVCQKPVISDYRKVPCLWYRTSVSFGKSGHDRHSGRSSSQSITNMAWFAVKDDTGQVMVCPGQPEVFGAETVFNGAAGGLGQIAHLLAPGYVGSVQVTELAFKPEGHVVVVGKANSFHGGMVIHDPTVDPASQAARLNGPSNADPAMTGASTTLDRAPSESDGFMITTDDKAFNQEERRKQIGALIFTFACCLIAICYFVGCFRVRTA